MNKQFEYKGYIGSAEVDIDNGIMFGRLLYIRDAIVYEGTSVTELRDAFHAAVDDYLDACREEHAEPDVPCKGSFNVRVGPELHRKVAIAARNQDLGLNEFVVWALETVVEPQAAKTVVHNHQWIMMGGEQRTAFTGDPKSFGLVSGWIAGDDAARH